MLSSLCIFGIYILAASPVAPCPACEPQLHPAHALIGQAAQSCLGESAGQVTDLIIAPQEDRVAYVVIKGNQPGFKRHVAVPWERISLSPAGGVTVDTHLAQLQKMPSLHRSEWMHLSDPQWQGVVRESFGLAPYSDPAIGMTRCASTHIALGEVRQMDVTATGLYRVGRVEDMIVDGCGRLAYAVVRLNDDCNPSLTLVPWSIVHVVPQDHKVMVEATPTELESVCFAAATWPDLCDPSFVQNLHLCLDASPYWEKSMARRSHCCPRDPWQTGSRYDLLFDPKQTAQVEGRIIEVGTFEKNWGEAGVRIKVLTKDGPVYTVQGGPVSQAHAAGLYFCKGQFVVADGSLNRKNKLMATEIRAGAIRWQIRDENGCLLW